MGVSNARTELYSENFIKFAEAVSDMIVITL